MGRMCGPMGAVPRAVWPGASALTSLGFSLLVCEPGLLCILNWKFSESQNFCPKSPSGAWSWQRPSPT